MQKFSRTLILLFLLLLCTIVTAQEYYANLEFDIQTQGSTTILGTTNYENLSPKTTQEFTSKNGKLWTFFANTNDLFSEYSYKITLPEGAKVQKIETKGTYIIQPQDNQIIIEGFGENIEFDIKIEYVLDLPHKENSLFFEILIIVLVLLAIGGIIFFVFKKIKSKKNYEPKEEFDPDVLTQRQLMIVKEIEKKNGKNTQAEIQKTLNMPKASLFRNIKGLEKKGIIKKERKGMTMILTLEKKEKKTNF